MTWLRPWPLAAALCLVASTPAPAPHPEGIARVAWLAGCWESVNPRRVIEEQWTAPRGRNMVGMGRTVRGDSLVDYELTIIREEGDRLAYEAHPAGQPEATFRSIQIGESNVTFENLEHDFPQRVMYRLSGPDSLIARIEGTENGKTRGIDFPYSRATCGR